ncbi:MAG: multidrug effflux MFS transporter [Pseudomonadota bacterium]
MYPKILIVFCGLLLGLSAYSIDSVLPAFGEITADFGVPISLAQATVPVFSLPFAFGHLFYGPLSDRFGRRPAIAVGLSFFAAGSLLASLSTSVEFLLAARFIQGFGGASAPVVARAILRDHYDGPKLAGSMSFAMTVFSVAVMVAPPIGYAMIEVGNWRWIFFAQMVLAILLLLINQFVFRESHKDLDVSALRPGNMVRAMGRVFRHPQSRTFLILASLAQCALLSFVVNGPLLFENGFGITGLTFALLFSAMGTSIILGQWFNRWAIVRVGVLASARIASSILFASSFLCFALEFSGLLTLSGFLALMFLFGTSFLVVIANSTALIIDPHKEIAGLTSALFGFCTIATSAIFVLVTVPIFDGSVMRWAAGMSLMTAISTLGYLASDLLTRPKNRQ